MAHLPPTTVHRMVDQAWQESRDADDTAHFEDRLVGSIIAALPATKREAVRTALAHWEATYGPDYPRGVGR